MEENKKFLIDNKKIWVAGGNGMVGKSIINLLKQRNCKLIVSDRKDLDLTDQGMVTKWMSKNKPDLIFLAAAKVGGIHANKSFPVNFLEENLLININIIKNAFINGTEKLVNLGSSCIYPKNIMHSIKEDKILSGPLEETNQWYSLAKISELNYAKHIEDNLIVTLLVLCPQIFMGQATISIF